MPAVTISPKFQVVIPKEVRESLGLIPGEKLEIFQYQGRIELVPVKDIRELQGFLKGIDTTIEPEEDRV